MKKLRLYGSDILLYVVALFSYATFISILGWVKPPPSDQLEYLQGVEWGTTVGFWPWLDRVAFGASLGFLRLIPLPVYHTGPAYALLVNCISLLITMFWLHRRYNFASAWIFSLVFFSSWYAYFFGTQVFPEPTQILFGLLSILPFIDYLRTKNVKYVRVAGFFSAWVGLVKITSAIIPIVFVIMILRNSKNRQDLKNFFMFFCLGIVSIFVIYTAAYGPYSTWDMIYQFVTKNFSFMYKGRAEANNIVSYLDVVLNRSFLPIFLSLFIFSGIYRDTKFSRIATFSWIFFLVLYGIHIISGRGGPIINNYMYPTFYFSAIVFSAYVGSVINFDTPTKKIIWTFAGLLSLVIGVGIAARGNTSYIFQPGHHGFLTFPLKFFFNTGVLLLIVLPLLFEIKKSEKLAKSMIIVLALWCTAYNVGSLRRYYSEILLPEANFYYDNMHALSLVKEKSYNIYVEEWLKSSHSERIVWGVYRHFYRDKYHVEGSDAQIESEKLILENISYLNKESEIAESKHKFFLTDLPEKIKKYHPSATQKESFIWNNITLYVLEVL